MENKEILVCYYCGILYDDQYEECSCGCAAKPISTKELAALNLTNTSRLRNIEKTSPPSPATEGKQPSVGESLEKVLNAQYTSDSKGIDGKEEDGDKWQRLSDTLLKRSDWAHAIAAEKGQYYSGLSDGLAQAVKQMESLLEDKIEPPTPPAGAEGDGEMPEHVKDFIEKKVTEIGSPWGTFNAGMRAMGREMWQVTEKQTKMYVEVAASTAQAKIAELQARVNELQEWHDSHL